MGGREGSSSLPLVWLPTFRGDVRLSATSLEPWALRTDVCNFILRPMQPGEQSLFRMTQRQEPVVAPAASFFFFFGL